MRNVPADVDAAVVPASRKSLPMRVWARARRPEGLVERARWLFALCALLALSLTLPVALGTATVYTLPLAIASSVALAVSWIRRYLTRDSPIRWDILDAVAMLAFTLSCMEPAAALRIAFSCLWFRALYSSTRRVYLYSAGVCVGLITALPLWELVPGNVLETPMPVLTSLPVAFLTIAVARHLALGLFAREQSQRRDAALSLLSAELLGLTDRDTIYGREWDTVAAICAATPGLGALGVRERQGSLEVTGHAGEFLEVPATLPLDVLPGPTALGEVAPVADDARLVTYAPGRWFGIRLPERPGGWMLLVAPHAVPEEAAVAIGSMLNNVALALRTSDAHQDLATQAHTDSLTGLANRAAFTGALELAIAESAELVVLFLDLDDFKTINDGLGHAAGDELLRHVAARIRRAVRPGDLCARLGGDEFAVLLHDASDGKAVAERLVGLVAAPLTLTGRHAQVGVSIGLANVAPDMSAEQLMQHADIAMYAAKAKGKNRVQVFAPTLLQVDEQAALEAELRAAVEADQFVVHYQPILSLPDGACTAVEALVRWQHPARGLLNPSEFVPSAERTGLIRDIGAFVLRQACADIAHLTDGDAGRMGIHINVAAGQLNDPAFHALVLACIADFDLAPQQLVLEITEAVVLDSPAVRAGLDDLVGVGVVFAIDDFGTGYSALTTLRTLPLHTVKIDRSFVAGCPTNPADQTVVEAIVEMAKRLGLRTVAEGVERIEQQQFLCDVGADAAQGFLHLRPSSITDLTRWLGTRPPAAQPASRSVVTLLNPNRAR